jgi:HK97 family phage prohead protease
MSTRKTYTTSTVKAGDTPTITITTAMMDREGDVVVPTGGDFSAYKRNPVVLFAHDYSSLPVGRCIDLHADERGIRASWQWLKGDDRAAAVRNAWEQGVLNAASIGFKPIEARPIPGSGTQFDRWEMLEFSLVPVPANPGATRQLMKRLGFGNDDILGDLSPSDIADAMATGVGAAMNEVMGGIASVVARETKNTIDRMRGRIVDDDDIALDIIDDPASRRHRKAGRVLSGRNERLIRNAIDAHTNGVGYHQKGIGHLKDVLNSMSDDEC